MKERYNSSGRRQRKVFITNEQERLAAEEIRSFKSLVPDSQVADRHPRRVKAKFYHGKVKMT